MLKPTKFLLRSSKTSRLLDFSHHMFANGFNTSFDQVTQSLNGLQNIDLSKIQEWKNALKSIYCYNFDTYEKFDEEEKKQISKDKIIIKITIQLILEVFLLLRSKVHLTMNQQINP